MPSLAERSVGAPPQSALGAGLLTPPLNWTEGLHRASGITDIPRFGETYGPTKRRGQETRAERRPSRIKTSSVG